MTLMSVSRQPGRRRRRVPHTPQQIATCDNFINNAELSNQDICNILIYLLKIKYFLVL